MPDSEKRAFSHARIVYPLISVALICWLVLFAPIPGDFAFTAFDDGTWLMNARATVNEPASAFNLIDGRFKPTFHFTAAIIEGSAGASSPGWMWAALLLHLAAGVLLFLALLKRLGDDIPPWVAALAATLWLIHPVNHRQALWISALPIHAVLSFASLWLAFVWRESGKWPHAAWAALLLILAMLAKLTSALMLPFFVLILLSRGERFGDALKSSLPLVVAVVIGFAVSLPFALARFEKQDLHQKPLGLSVDTFKTYFTYQASLIVPAAPGEAAIHETPDAGALRAPWKALLLNGLGPHILLLTLILGGRRVRWLAVYTALAIIPFALVVWAPVFRYLYLPSIGFCVLFALLALRLSRASRLKSAGPALAVLLIAIVLAGSLHTGKAYRAHWRSLTGEAQAAVEAVRRMSDAKQAVYFSLDDSYRSFPDLVEFLGGPPTARAMTVSDMNDSKAGRAIFGWELEQQRTLFIWMNRFGEGETLPPGMLDVCLPSEFGWRLGSGRYPAFEKVYGLVSPVRHED